MKCMLRGCGRRKKKWVESSRNGRSLFIFSLARWVRAASTRRRHCKRQCGYGYQPTLHTRLSQPCGSMRAFAYPRVGNSHSLTRFSAFPPNSFPLTLQQARHPDRPSHELPTRRYARHQLSSALRMARFFLSSLR